MPKNDDYYDDRLSRDSQLDTHLKELVSDRVDSGEFGSRAASVFTAHEEEDSSHLDKFYGESG
jgi:hypothetical protein